MYLSVCAGMCVCIYVCMECLHTYIHTFMFMIRNKAFCCCIPPAAPPERLTMCATNPPIYNRYKSEVEADYDSNKLLTYCH